MRKKNVNERRKVALRNLENAKFFPKQIKSGKKMVDRSEETWNDNRDDMIETLNKRITS